jgi:hypothetical protein
VVKLIVKLAIVALLANAGYRIGSEYLTYIKFRDDIRDAAMFKAKNDEELSKRILELAAEYDIPLSEDGFSIRREERRVHVDGHYQKPIEVVPQYVYRWPFSWSIEAMTSTIVPPFTPRR